LLDRIFQFRRNQTTAGREFAAGATTFLTMAYIVLVDPGTLAAS